MKKVLLFILLIPSFSFAQESIISKTELAEVKLYLNGAYINRTAKVQLAAGNNEVVFSGLSPYIDPASITVKGSGDATLLNISFKQDYLKDRIKPKEIVALQALLDSLTYQYSRVLNKQAVLKEEENLILANKSIGGANSGVLADELELMVDFFAKKLTAIKEEVLENSLKEKKLKEQIDKVNNELAVKRNSYSQPDGNIVVKVKAATRSAASFEIAYMISSGATWTSFYDVRSKDVNSKVDIIYKAKITQNTGEDWVNTRLRLSTGNPSAGGVKPELYPWYLNFIKPQQLLRMRGARSDQESGVAHGQVPAMADEPAAKSFEWTPIQKTESQLSTEFVIADPYTVLSNNEEYQVDIQKYNLPATYEYVSAPKLDADVFLTAGITGWDALSLTAGPAYVYFDDGYVGESFINPVETGDTLTLSLGRDKRIIVKREKLKEFSSIRLFGSNKERTFAFEITVRNTKKDAINIVIEDQIPVSQDKDIEVKAEELSGAALIAESGKLTWSLSLQGNETRKLKFSFAVKYPKDKTVTGL
jgi:uncharacterized protein (TIGR02231 family)